MTLSAPMQTASERETISMVYMARLDFVDDPVIVWDGPGIFAPTTTGDAAMDGQIFTSLGDLGEISNIISTDTISEPISCSLSGVDIDDPLLRQVIRDKISWRGREAWLWMGLLDLTDPARPIIHFPKRLKYAYMTKTTTNRDREIGVVMVTIDEDVDRAVGKQYRYSDQRDYFAIDTAADFMHKLANSPTGIHGPSWIKPGSASYGGTSTYDGDRNCLSVNMKIKLFDGSYKLAGDLKVGDLLASFNTPGLIPQDDENYLKWSDATITDATHETAIVNRAKIITVPNYRLINGHLEVTGEHPYMVYRFARWQWIPISEINRGDYLLDEDFRKVPVTSNEFINEEIDVVNIGVDHPNTYFGGSINNKSILVHNK